MFIFPTTWFWEWEPTVMPLTCPSRVPHVSLKRPSDHVSLRFHVLPNISLTSLWYWSFSSFNACNSSPCSLKSLCIVRSECSISFDSELWSAYDSWEWGKGDIRLSDTFSENHLQQCTRCRYLQGVLFTTDEVYQNWFLFLRNKLLPVFVEADDNYNCLGNEKPIKPQHFRDHNT